MNMRTNSLYSEFITLSFGLFFGIGILGLRSLRRSNLYRPILKTASALLRLVDMMTPRRNPSYSLFLLSLNFSDRLCPAQFTNIGDHVNNRGVSMDAHLAVHGLSHRIGITMFISPLTSLSCDVLLYYWFFSSAKVYPCACRLLYSG